MSVNLKLIASLPLFAMSLFCAAAEPETAPAATPLKVMSYNIRYINTIDTAETAWSARRQPSRAMILTEHPDIIGFQEPRGEQRVNLVDDFNATYGVYSAVEDGVEEKYCGHVMIMYLNNRFTLLDKGAFWLSPTPDVPSKPEWNAIDKHYRMAIWVHLYDKLAKRDLYFCNTHLPYKAADNEARTACVQLITERLKKIAGDNAPLIVTGDMNASWSADDTRRNSIKGFFDWMGSARENAPVNLNPDTYSFNSFDASRARTTWNIDHIFYRNITPLEFNVVSSDKYGVKYVSDHYPITLSLTY